MKGGLINRLRSASFSSEVVPQESTPNPTVDKSNPYASSAIGVGSNDGQTETKSQYTADQLAALRNELQNLTSSIHESLNGDSPTPRNSPVEKAISVQNRNANIGSPTPLKPSITSYNCTTQLPEGHLYPLLTPEQDYHEQDKENRFEGGSAARQSLLKGPVKNLQTDKKNDEYGLHRLEGKPRRLQTDKSNSDNDARWASQEERPKKTKQDSKGNPQGQMGNGGKVHERVIKRIGDPTYESKDLALKLRPLPVTNNENSVFVECGDSDMAEVASAIYEQEADHIEAIDFHFGRKLLEIGISSTEWRNRYMDKGFRTKEKRWECRASIQKKSTLTWLHVDKVKLCNMQHSSDALLQAFSKIGTVVKIAPKIWEGIPIPSRAWLVVMTDIKGNVPQSLIVDGAPVTVETSGGDRVCREWFAVEHKESCSRG